MKRQLHILFMALLLTLSVSVQAQDEILGLWKTFDDGSGKSKAVVEIFSEGSSYSGRIVQLFREEGEEQDPYCEKCTGKDKGKKVIGLQIMQDMVFDDNEWDDGSIMDAENGKTYDCKIWLDAGKLSVRGYVGFFFRTQTWERY